MTQSTPQPRLREALYTLTVAKEIPDAKTLDDVICRYPQFANELVDFAVEIVLDFFREEESEDLAVEIEEGVSPAVSKAMSYYQNRIFELKQEKDANSNSVDKIEEKSAENPFTNLDRKSFRGLSQEINANATFVTRLRDRLINPETIPSSFIKDISQKLNRPYEVVLKHLQAPPVLASSQFYKSENKPKAQEQCTFEYALKNSGLTEEQQSHILQI